MEKKKYFEYVEDNADPMTLEAPPLECPKCGAQEGYRAEKCEKCGLIFFRGIVPNDYSDRCPECKHSAQEEARRRASGR
jgi:predicted Zn-ribbon and HTH transcriptional regulator